MIPMWMTAPGEDFKAQKFDERTVFVTADGVELRFETLARYALPVIGKTDDTLYFAFMGQRVAVPREQAMRIHGTILGKTKEPPQIRSAPASCPHDCSRCKGCIH